MISVEDFRTIITALDRAGFAAGDIAWAESCCLPPTAEEFALETIFVICNSGMQNKVARMIYEKCRKALTDGLSSATVFGHKGKTGAIDKIWRDRQSLYEEFLAAEDKLAWLAELPWIGHITKYHLAKNFGLDVAKPDVHLQRLADLHGTTAQELCADLAAQTGYRIATVDTLLWRACANGVVNSHTGQIAV